MFCTTCKASFELTAKIYADKQCVMCRREHGISTNLIIEASDPYSNGKRQLLGDIKIPEYVTQMQEITKVALLAPNMAYKVY